VLFDLTTFYASVIFDAAAQRVEGVAHGDLGVFVSVVRPGVVCDHNSAARQSHVDPHPEQVTLLVPMVLAINDDVARNYPVEKAAELLCTIANSRL
jgi:hypothetical protein